MTADVDDVYHTLAGFKNGTYSFIIGHELGLTHNEAVAALLHLWQAGRVQITAIEANVL